MRVLLDECVDRRLARDLPGHEVRHVRAIGWASLDDHELLRRADGMFDIFVTVDRGIAFQQNLSGLACGRDTTGKAKHANGACTAVAGAAGGDA